MEKKLSQASPSFMFLLPLLWNFFTIGWIVMSIFSFNTATNTDGSSSDSQEERIFEGQTTFSLNETSSLSIISPFNDICMVIFQFSREENVISWHTLLAVSFLYATVPLA